MLKRKFPEESAIFLNKRCRILKTSLYIENAGTVFIATYDETIFQDKNESISKRLGFESKSVTKRRV